MRILAGMRRAHASSTGCAACDDKSAQVARLEAALRSKAIETYPVITPGQFALADRIAFADKDRPWRTVTGTVVAYGWTSAGTFAFTLAAGWSWTDRLGPTAERPHGYYKINHGSIAGRFELPGDKKFRLLARIDVS